jgi:hypothetical protein
MTINNQCSNIELSSPICFTKDARCHEHFPQRVNSESIMKVNFITGVDQDTFGGASLYHSTNTQLLVIWGGRYGEFHWYALYLHACLIEHEKTLIWDKDKLKKLYDEYNIQWFASNNSGTWLLNNNTKLRTYCNSLYANFRMEVIISEIKNIHRPMKPLWVGPNR